MNTSRHITFRHMPASPALELKIREKFDKLTKLYPEILAAEATVDQVDRHQKQGRHIRITISVRIRGEELIANTNHEDAYIALRNAVTALRHQLDKALGKRRLALALEGGDDASEAAEPWDVNTMPETLPFMEEEEAVALLSGAARLPNAEHVIEDVEKH